MIARGFALATLATEEFDLLVIGGGITGAGVALDAASRGLAVGLVERGDFASSAGSSGPPPNAPRRLHLRAAREALAERELMLELAPRLVERLPLVVPAWGRAHPVRLLGDAHRHRRLSAAEVTELVPALAARRPDSGYVVDDCQADEVRLVLTLLGEAERRGAVCANRLEAVELVEARGRIACVEVRDAEGDGRFLVVADRVVNATGAAAARLLPREAPPIRTSLRSHVVLRSGDLGLEEAGVVLPRRVTARPWLGRVLVGPFGDDYPAGPDEARTVNGDADRLLGAVNSFFGTGLEPADVVGAFATLRPLDGSRKARIHLSRTGVVTVTGGGLTTWRRIAKRTVDRLVQRDGRKAPCRTHEIELAPWPDRSPLARQSSDPHTARRHLTHRYGTGAGEVLAIAAGDPALDEPIVEGWPDLVAEAAYASVHEQARSVGDVLLRRTRLGLVAAREVACQDVALRVAGAMAPALGWSACRTQREAAAWASVKDPFKARS